MKRYLMYFCFCLVCYQAEAQFGSGTPPNVEWRKTDLWPETHLLYTGATPTVTDAQSGHDWFWRSSVIRNGSNQPNGYIHAGYGTMPAVIEQNFDQNYIRNNGGCGFTFYWEHACYTGATGVNRGIYSPTIMLSDLNGNHSPSDSKFFPFHGGFASAIETSDGGYIVVGSSFMSSMMNITNGQLSGGVITNSNLTLTPIIYNPSVGNTSTDLATVNPGYSCDWNFFQPRGLVVKLDANLNMQWYYLHGLKPHTQGQSTPHEGIDLVHVAESIHGGYILFGSSYDVDLGFNTCFVRKIDQNGLILWTKVINTNATPNGPGDMTLNVEDGNEYIYVAGNYYTTQAQIFATKLDATNGNDVWSTPVVYYDPTTTGDVVNRIDIAPNGDLLVSGVAGWEDPNGKRGHISRLNPGNGNVITTVIDNVIISAPDLKYCVTATADNGCAVSSTVLRSRIDVCSPVYYQCGFDGGNNTDAYVAKFNSTLVKEWSGRVDANTMTPLGNAPDIVDCSTVTNPAWTLDPSALDLKRQECLFDIIETPDGGLLITGKNSLNQDDYYLIKICNVSPTIISGQTISTTQNVSASYYITVDNTTVTNTGNLTMEACKYIYMGLGTNFVPGSVVSAQINPGICCGSESQGERLANVEFENSTFNAPSNPILPEAGALNAIVFPNPNNGNFTIQITSQEHSPVKVSVYNQMGTLLYSQGNINAFGKVEISADLKDQEKGMYFVRIDYGGKYITRKFIIE